ncbi:MAG: CotH kinase family protein [Treponema sp.]|nr:CotH kinase family protein [Treponema sp.]MCL2237125.1 CotH kinase family protein [Treponema sp.]
MSKNKILYTKLIIAAIPAFVFLFASCPIPDETDNENGITGTNPGQVRGLAFSHKSGHYSGSFSLVFSAAQGAEIYYSIDGSIPDPDNLVQGRTFLYTAPIQVMDRNGQPNLLATLNNSEKFYGFSFDPRGNMPIPFLPSDINARVPKATIIRAFSVNSSGNKSDVATLTYFIENNLENYGNHPIISIITDPYNLIDENDGMYVRGNINNRWEGANLYNFRQNWRKPASFELFDSNKNVSISTNLEIRIRGGWSRAQGQKSMNIYFTNAYGGINNLVNYQLIPGAIKADGTPLTSTKSFMIRSGGNDLEYTKFYDVFAQRLLKDRAFTTQSAIPCIVYINGEYWGPYNLQERYSDNHTEYVFGINRNNVVSIESGSIDDGTPADEFAYNEMMNRLIAHDMSNPDNYEDFLGCFDVQSFIDYWAAEIYLCNEDWPQNNFRLWRARTPVANNPYGDGKWRYQMLDMDFIMGIYTSGSLDTNGNPFHRILYGEHKDSMNSRLFTALLANDDFKGQFTNTMMDLYNMNFHPNTYVPILNELVDIYRPLMGDDSSGYFMRWGRPWDSVFNDKVNNAYKYLHDIRNAMVYNYLPQYLGADGLSNVILTANIPNISLKINTITPLLASGIWTGQYFDNCQITVTAANAPAGYEFEKWIVNGIDGASTQSAAITLNGNTTITASYKLTGIQAVPVTGITLNKANTTLTAGSSETLTANVAPNNASIRLVSWTSSDFNVASVDNTGKITAISGGTATITATTIDGGKTASCIVTVQAPIPLNWTWGYYADPETTAAISGIDHGNGEYSANVSSLGSDPWNAIMIFNYSNEAKANAKYSYTFYARTESGTRNIYVQYYWTGQYGSKGQAITMTENYQPFTITGDYLPTSNGLELQFQAGGQLGTFYVKDVVITPIP